MERAFNPKSFYDLIEKKIPYEEEIKKDLSNLLRKEFILSKIKKFKGSLLDVGCNTGYYGCCYNNGPYIGLDIAKEAIKVARKKLPNSTFFVGTAENLSCLEDNSVDNILCSETIEHLIRPQNAISEFYRILKPGGFVLLSCPNFFRNRPTWVSSPIHKLHGINKKFFHTAYRPEELKAMMEKACFKTLEKGLVETEAAVMNLITYAPFKILSLFNWFPKSKTVEKFNYRWRDAFQVNFYVLLKKLKLSVVLKLNLGPITAAFCRSYVLCKKEKK